MSRLNTRIIFVFYCIAQSLRQGSVPLGLLLGFGHIFLDFSESVLDNDYEGEDDKSNGDEDDE